MATFQSEHPAIHHWLVTNVATSSFARSVLKSVSRGSVSQAQIARVRQMVDCEQRQRRGRQGKRSAAAEAIIAMTMPVEPRED
jgi:hypothetical protein